MTVPDPLEALTAHCGTCGGINEVAWCAAWLAYLCVNCRAVRNENELRVPLAARGALREAGTETGHG